MAFNINDISSYLFKKLMGTSSTDVHRQFFEEPYLGRLPIFSSDVWNQSDMIPNTVPLGLTNDGDIQGVVEYKKDLILSAVPGAPGAFYSPLLIDAIPFNFGDGSYNYSIKNSIGQVISFGLGDWIVDGSSGVITFYGIVPPNMPPTITFYRYIGTKGVGSGSGNNVPGTKKKIGPTESIIVQANYQYFVYGTLELQGDLINSGEVAVGTLFINGGTFTNTGDLTLT